MCDESRESTSYLSFDHVLDGQQCFGERLLTSGMLVRVHGSSKRQKLGADDEESVIGVVGSVVGSQLYTCVACNNDETDKTTHSWLWCSLRHISTVDRAAWSATPVQIRTALVDHAWTTNTSSDVSEASSEIAPPRTRNSLSSSLKEKSPPVDITKELEETAVQFTDTIDLTTITKTPNDLLVDGAWIEVQHVDDPLLVKLTQIEHNFGGYLKLTDNKFIHYLHERVHAVGWTESVDGVARQVGMRCELMDPINRVEFGPAAITKLHGPYYFSVVKDSIRTVMASPIKEETTPKETALKRPSLTALFEAQRTKPDAQPSPAKHARLSVPTSPLNAPPLRSSTSAPAPVDLPMPDMPKVETEMKPTADLETKETPMDTTETKAIVDAKTPLVVETHMSSTRPKKASIAQEWICHRESLNILPATWCSRNAVRITPPLGYPTDQEFSWGLYRSMTELTTWDQANESYFPSRPYSAARFTVGTALEVVDENDRTRLIPATVARVFKHIIWLRFDSISTATYSRAYHCKSLDVFPAGFAAIHGLTLAPRVHPGGEFVDALLPTDENFTLEETSPFREIERPYMMPMYAPGSTSWSPNLYVNETCCIGPYFTRAGILRKVQREFPAAPLHIQLQCILSRLLLASTRMQTMIDLWKLDTFYKSDAHVSIKFRTSRRPSYVKDKRTTIVNVSVPSSSADLPAFLHHLFTIIDACPCLISTEKLGADNPCPYKCHEVLHDKCNSSTTHPLTGYKALRHQVKRGGRGRIAGMPTSSLTNPLPNVKRRRRIRKQRERTDDDDDETRSAEAQRRPVTRGVRVKLVRPHPSTQDHRTASQQAAGRISRNIRQQFSNKDSRRSSIMSPSKQRLHKQYTFAQIRDKPIGITIPRRKDGRPRVAKEEDDMDPIGTRSRRIPVIKTDPGTWSAQQLADWLTACKQSKELIVNLLDEEVDGHAFMLLTLDDCIDYLNLTFGDALKLVTVVSEVKQVYLRMFGEAETKTY